MKHMSAHEAKSRFGQLLDTAQREPVSIEKHGRSVAVLVSKEDFDEIEAMKLSKLREEVKKGIEASQANDSIEIEFDELDSFIEKIMTYETENISS